MRDQKIIRRSRGLGIKNQNGTRKPRTKPFSLSSLTEKIFKNSEKRFTKIQNHKSLIRVFRVIRAVRVAL
jgi:hypothetical protein